MTGAEGGRAEEAGVVETGIAWEVEAEEEEKERVWGRETPVIGGGEPGAAVEAGATTGGVDLGRSGAVMEAVGDAVGATWPSAVAGEGNFGKSSSKLANLSLSFCCCFCFCRSASVVRALDVKGGLEGRS